MARLDRIEGDIDTLTTRIAHVRTWTYISHSRRLDGRRAPLAGARARDRGPAVRRAARPADPALRRPPHRRTDAAQGQGAARRLVVAATGEVEVEGHYVGRLDGFRFAPDVTASGDDTPRAARRGQPRAHGRDRGPGARAWSKLARRRFHAGRRWAHLLARRRRWRGSCTARARSRPAVEVLDSAFLSAADREAIGVAARGVDGRAARARPRGARGARARASLSGPARGLAYQLVEALGTVARGPRA